MRLIVITVFSILAVPLPATAQTSRNDADWARMARLAPGAEVRVVLASGKTIRGFLQSATPDSLALNATTSQEMLVRQDIQRVQVKRPGHRGRNTLIGLGIGAGAGLAVGAAADRNSGGGFALDGNAGKIILGPLGAIVGMVAGVAIPTGAWHDLYRKR